MNDQPAIRSRFVSFTGLEGLCGSDGLHGLDGGGPDVPEDSYTGNLFARLKDRRSNDGPTVEKFMKEIQHQMAKWDKDVFDICPDCSQGRLTLYSAQLNKPVCNWNCPKTRQDLSAKYSIDKDMKAIQRVLIEADKLADQILESFNELLVQFYDSNALYSLTTDQHVDRLEFFLKHIIESAQEMLSEKERIVDQFYPDLAKERQKSSDLMVKINKCINELTTTQKSVKEILASLETITVPTAESTVPTILKLDQAIIDKGVRLSAEIKMKEERLHDDLIYIGSSNTTPIDFDDSPHAYVNMMMAKMMPRLTADMDHWGINIDYIGDDYGNTEKEEDEGSEMSQKFNPLPSLYPHKSSDMFP